MNLPEGLEEIQDNAFEECKFLRQIILPTTLKTIGESAFKDCFNLKELNLPNGIETLKKNFIKNCKKIKNFTVPTTVKNLRNPNDTYFSYVEKTDDGFTVMHKSTEKSYPIEDIKIEIPLFFNYKDINPNLINEQKNDVIAELYNLLNYSISSEQMDEFMRNHNFTFFKKIMKNIPTNRYSGFNKDAFCIGYYNLGGFIPMADYNGKKVDYSQKVAGKLQEYIDREEFRPYENLSYSFETMKADGFKKDFTDFYLGNLRELMSENIFYREFISRVYNQFEEVQATNTSNRGSQRQLKPTIEKFRNYFRGSIFKGVTPETQQIADTVSAYSNSQYTFDKAVDIMNEFEIKKSPNNILSIPLVQELSPFENIDSTAEKIEELQVETAGNLAQVASRQLTYEWLEKNDPTNLILGKLCSCCAHLEGAGYGIMHASIVHPNVQNLVVRDDEDKIIAKSTLFINPNEQYGLLNNFEVRNGFTYEENIETYKTFMQGIADFAKQYNIEHPDKPLKQINVGGGNNDLLGHLLKYNEKAEELFESLDYGNYGNGPHNYRGDSYFSQFIVWKNDELEKNKEEEIEKIQEIEK
ncbi:MAG: leucine-rich repeat domain-containing protein [Clostridia bacterium]|nr:leucine-rich repeat domain-containing protein [Clostridia bacterium]